MTAYYNEIDPYAAEWLRNLIAAGHIAHGVVDTRSIEDVRPDELAGYTQCHFFAGIGVWSRALRLAGWPDDRPVWTGSCPCQPFSAAGKGAGTADERHLWPAWQWLIAQCRPRVIFGEQVEAAIKHDWLDLVQADLEGLGYAVGAAGLPAAGVGAPHGRARLWFVADHEAGRRSEVDPLGGRGDEGVRAQGGERLDSGRELGGLAHDDAAGRLLLRPSRLHDQGQPGDDAVRRGADGELAHREREGLEGHAGDVDDGNEPGWLGADEARPVATGGGSSFWSACDWLPCRDGKARPVEPGTFPLAHGVAARVGKLRAYGNAIVSQVAAEVIGAFMDAADGK